MKKNASYLRRLKEKEFEVLVCTGAAGSGKSHFIKEISELAKEWNIEPVLLAPTGSARKVLSQRVNGPVSTIHSKLYKYNDESSEFDYRQYNLRNLESDNEQWVICDESSMIPAAMQKSSSLFFGSGMLLQDLFEAFGSKASYIFVGDPNQLPPIGESSSPALDPKYISETFHRRVESMHLEGNYRQESQDIINFARKLLKDKK